MKTLVTGGTGFIGSHLIERLRERGDEVLCIARETMYADILHSLNVPIILGDLNNGIPWEKVLHDIEVVYHVAGVTRSKNTRDYYEGNTLATRRLLQQCLWHAGSLRRFVYVSSLTATGPSCEGKPVDETTPYHPVSHYGRSKMLAELEVLRLAGRIPVTIVRPSSVYGPRDRDWCEYIRLILRRLQLLIGMREKYMSLIHSDDLVDGIIRAAEHPRGVGATYFLASEQVYSVRQIGESICHALRVRPLRIHLPHCLVYLIGAAGEMVGKLSRQEVFFNIQKVRESVQPAWVCSVQKARREIGFRQRVGLDAGMGHICAWYRDQGWL
jgi:nucleoside-diphosphate-sugar epimerase